jgi:biopolymer transport protein TolR
MHLQRKRGSADLNLVPYIDLLTCMIAFLLITAVWTQLARLEVQQRGQGAQEDGIIERPTRVVVAVGEDGFNLLVEDDRQLLPRRDRAYDFAALATALGKVKDRFPDKKDLLVASEDGVPFETLVATMDAALGAGFPALSLIDDGAAGL